MNNFVYADIHMSIIRHPGTDDVVKRFDVDAIKTSVKNILATNKGEKLFLPEFGADLHGLLFELITPAVKLMARRKIMEEIQIWEPRIRITTVDIVAEEHLGLLMITLNFYILEKPETEESVTVKLQRVR